MKSTFKKALTNIIQNKSRKIARKNPLSCFVEFVSNCICVCLIESSVRVVEEGGLELCANQEDVSRAFEPGVELVPGV